MNRFKSSYQAGFGAVEGLLIVVVITLAGTIGWVAYTKFVANPTNTQDTQLAQGIADLQKPVAIETASDIDKASQDIDDVDINDDSTLSEAESAVNSL